MNRNHAKRKGHPDATRCCADGVTLARVLEAARTSAGAVAQRVVRNWHTAEDVVQEALLRAVVAQDQLQEIANLEAWFRGVVRNIAVDRVRREVREREIMEALSAAGAFADVVPHQRTETLEQAELRDLIREAMSQLSAYNRRVIELFYLKNQTLKQVSDCLGVSPNTVKQRLFRARDMLKRALIALSMDAYSTHATEPRKAIIMKTTQEIVGPTHSIPPGWHLFGNIDHYSVQPDPDCRLAGPASVTVVAGQDVTDDMTAGLMQRFPAGQWRGRRLLARLWVKAEGVSERGFHAYLMAQDAAEVGCHVYWPRVGGTFDWRPIEAIMDVPTGDCFLRLVFAVIGSGQAWVDRVELEDVGTSALPREMATQLQFHSLTWRSFTNLDFSDATKTLAAAPRLPALAPGWYTWNSWPVAQVVGLDREVVQTGSASACIDHRQTPSRGLDMIYQRVPVDEAWRGRHLQMRGWVKTAEAERAGLWLRTDAAADVCTAMDDMRTRPLAGCRDWTPYELVAAITPEVTHVAFGALLHGTGAIWIDRVEFQVVDSAVPSTTEMWNRQGRGLNAMPQAVPGRSEAWPRFRPHTSKINNQARNLEFSEAVH